MFKERQVDNLMKLIYNEDTKDTSNTPAVQEAELTLDTNRYDVATEKLSMFKRDAVKKKLKKKFVTGQT